MLRNVVLQNKDDTVLAIMRTMKIFKLEEQTFMKTVSSVTYAGSAIIIYWCIFKKLWSF